MSRGRLRSRRFPLFRLPVGRLRRSGGSRPSRRGGSGLFSDPGAIWDLRGRDAYVDPERRRQLPRWFVPFLALVVIAVLVFWGAPAAVARLRHLAGPDGGGEGPAATVYGQTVLVVSAPVADVYANDDLLAPRSTQVLYNEPVTKTSKAATFGFVAVRLSDGQEGFMRQSDLVSSHESIEPAAHIARILVTDLTKRVFSHASSGTLLVETVMGTLLLTDYAGDGVFRVTLPSGEKGWIGSNGVMELPLDDSPVPRSDSGRYFTNTALSFLNVPYVDHGISRHGACPEGIARVAAAVNGVVLPRSLQGQIQAGEAVEVERDENGDPVYGGWMRGDLVFFASPADPEQPGRLGIYVDYAQVLTFRTGRSDIRILNLPDNPSLEDNILAVRRLFPAGGGTTPTGPSD